MKGFEIKAMAGVIVLEIFGEFGWWTNLEDYLRWQIKEIGEEAPLHIHIDSIGGDPRSGMALYNIIQSHKGKTTAFIEYMCASSATLPACACDEVIGNEFPFEYMIHDPSILMDWVTLDEIEGAKAALKSSKDDMVRVYVEKTGQSEATILQWMKETKWMKSDEALELGFIDQIQSIDSTLEEKVDYELAAKAYADKRPKEFEIKGRGKSPEPSNNNTQIKSKMEEFFKKVKAAFGLGDTSDEADVVIRAKELKAQADKVDQLEKDNATLTKERDDALAKVAELEGEEPTEEELEQQAEQEVDAQLEAAIKDFKISASAKENYAKTYKGKPDELKAALELIEEGAAKPKGSPRQSAKAKAGAGVHPEVAAAWGK